MTVRVDVVEEVIVVGENTGVSPVGAVAERSTEPVNPLSGLMEIVDVCEPPAVAVIVVGLGETVKSAPMTLTVTVVSLNRKPPVLVVLLPVTSTV